VSDRGFNEDKTATIKAQRGDTRNALTDKDDVSIVKRFEIKQLVL
jgi:hypothetical protein